jgi:hypothetical protein
MGGNTIYQVKSSNVVANILPVTVMAVEIKVKFQKETQNGWIDAGIATQSTPAPLNGSVGYDTGWITIGSPPPIGEKWRTEITIKYINAYNNPAPYTFPAFNSSNTTIPRP